MTKFKINFFILTILSLMLSGCATHSQMASTKTAKNTEYVAILSDPLIRKDFKALERTARTAHTYKKEGKTYFYPQDIKTLDAISAQLVDILHYQYHLDPQKYKIHTYVGKNQNNSCYQYYNSMERASIGQHCEEFSNGFSSCDLCNQYLKKIRTASSPHVIHAHWWKNENIVALVNIIQLRNHDSAYAGFEFSSAD